MSSFLGGFFGGIVGGIVGYVAIKFISDMEIHAVVPQQKYRIKYSAPSNGNGVQIESYLQPDWYSFGAIDSAVLLTKRDANNALRILEKQYSGATLIIEPIGSAQIAMYE